MGIVPARFFFWGAISQSGHTSGHCLYHQPWTAHRSLSNPGYLTLTRQVLSPGSLMRSYTTIDHLEPRLVALDELGDRLLVMVSMKRGCNIRCHYLPHVEGLRIGEPEWDSLGAEVAYRRARRRISSSSDGPSRPVSDPILTLEPRITIDGNEACMCFFNLPLPPVLSSSIARGWMRVAQAHAFPPSAMALAQEHEINWGSREQFLPTLQ